MSRRIPVLEIFGPTIQGEGMVMGQKTMFVRTAGCDYSCSWCDSAFTWDGSAKNNIVMLTANEIFAQLIDIGGENFNHVTISGGNPALIAAIDDLIYLLHDHNIRVALETQGSKWQDWFLHIDDLTLSPKPPSSGMTTDFKILDDILTRLKDAERNDYSIKIVIFDEIDFEYATTVYKRYPNVPLYLQVGNEDIHSTDDQQLTQDLLRKYEWLIDKTIQSKEMNSVRVLPQLHTLVWGNKRGV